MKKIYIAGPMTGLPQSNYPAFHAAAAMLRTEGHHVENPAENPEPACGTWQGYMRMALKQLADCDAIHLLPGWERSRGARIEFDLAKGLGLEIQGAAGLRCHDADACAMGQQPCPTPAACGCAAPAAVAVTDALAEIVGCFDAANVEGLDDAIVNNTDARLSDLVQRRLLPAFYTAIAAQAAAKEGAQQG